MLAKDDALDRTLKEADDTERDGRDVEAADILKRKSWPAADEAVAAAAALSPRSDWGKREKDALVALEHDRKEELAPYEAALRASDVNAKIGALKKQLEIELRAKKLAEEVDRGP